MRKIITGAISASALLLSGCTATIAELRHPGGYPGKVLDDRMFDASDSKKLQLLRATIILAMLARMGATSAENREDGDTIVKYTVSAVDEINILAGHITTDPLYKAKGLGCPLARPDKINESKDVTSATLTAAEATARDAVKKADDARIAAEKAQKGAENAQRAAVAAANVALAPNTYIPAATTPSSTADKMFGNSCYTYAVNFESDIKILEGKLFKLALLSLPKKAARQLLDDVSNGDILGSILSALRFALSSIDGLRAGAAVQRTGLEIEAHQMPGTKKGHSRSKGRTIDICGSDHITTVKGSGECLGLPVDTIFSGKIDGLDKEVPDTSFHALMRNIYDSCRLAPFVAEVGWDDVKFKAARENRINECNKIEYKPKSRWAADQSVLIISDTRSFYGQRPAV